MKRHIATIVVLAVSLATVLAIAVPDGHAIKATVSGNGVQGYASTEYVCKGMGVVSYRADSVGTGGPGTSAPYAYFQTRVHRWTNSGWVDMGLVKGQEWIWGNIGGPYNLNFGVGYGKVRFITTIAIWDSYRGRYVYYGPQQEMVLWSNGQVFGDAYSCTL